MLKLSQLFDAVGNHAEFKRILAHSLVLWGNRRDTFQVAQTLMYLVDANRILGHTKEGVLQAKEAVEIYERTRFLLGQAHALQQFARLLFEDGQVADAEEAATRALDLAIDRDEKSMVCRCHRVLGEIYQSKGETEKAVSHFEATIEIASSFNWHHELFWTHYTLASPFCVQEQFDEAYAHIERSRPHAAHASYLLSRAMEMQAYVWFKQHLLEEAKLGAFQAASVFDQLGAAKDFERCLGVLGQAILEEINNPVASQSGRPDEPNSQPSDAPLAELPK